MKLIFCPICQDVVRLRRKMRSCECQESCGHYTEDDINAVIYGKAIPIGFTNSSFVEAILNRPDYGQGRRFDAFVIPRECKTITEKLFVD